MAKVLEGVVGIAVGGFAVLTLLVGGASALWEIRMGLFDQPGGDDGQFYGFLVVFGLSVAVLTLPVIIMGGLLGTWLATRDPDNRIDTVGAGPKLQERT